MSLTSQRKRRALSPDEGAAWRGLLRVHSRVLAHQDAELKRRYDLSVTEWEVLRAVSGAPGGRLRIGDIGSLVVLTTGGVTRLVTRLEQRGLVERIAHDADRRGVAVRLTDAGSDLQHRGGIDLVGILRAQFLDRLDEGQIAALIAIWETALPGSAIAADAQWAAVLDAEDNARADDFLIGDAVGGDVGGPGPLRGRGCLQGSRGPGPGMTGAAASPHGARGPLLGVLDSGW